jgi:hypothetical protein
MSASSLRSSRGGSVCFGSRSSGSENVGYFYEYEYEYEINTKSVSSYRPLSYQGSGSRGSAFGSYRMSAESGSETVQVFGYGINLI